MKDKTKSILKVIGTLIFFLILIYFLEGWGWIGLVVFILGIVSMRVWKERGFLKSIMRQAEMIIWKKPLDKDMWDKGEMKNTKLKIVWGKGNYEWDKYIGILIYPALLLLFLGVMFNSWVLTNIGFAFFGLWGMVKLGYMIERCIKNGRKKCNKGKSCN